MKRTECFVEAVTRRRKEMGMTNYELAKIAGVSRESLYKLEAGKHTPTLETAEKVCRALGMVFVIGKEEA